MQPSLRNCSPLLVFVALLATGCNQGRESLDQTVLRAAKLPGVRGSAHSKLREEFRLVEASRTLPEQLNSEPLLAHQNAAVALDKALADMDKVAKINQHAGAFLGALPAADEPFVVAESGALSAKWLRETQAVAEASELPSCDFGLKFERGYFNDLDFVYQAAAGCRLLLVEALYHQPDDPRAAVESFRAAWRWTDCLAATGHLEARVQASLLRSEAANVMEVIANEPNASVDELRQLHEVLTHSLEQWPPLRATLVRERAMALAAYEAIRLGLVDLLFTPAERGQLRVDGVYDSLRRATDEQIDADEAAYLTYMREVISVADKPFYMRSKHLVECDRLLRASEQTGDYPWFANHLFVLEESLTMAQAELARDRARVEGWLHLLAAAIGEPPPPSDTNPLNGEKYVAQTTGNESYVALGDRRTVNPRMTMPSQ